MMVGMAMLHCVPASASARADSAAKGAVIQPATQNPDREGDIVVTGTRLMGGGFTAPTPVTAADTADLLATTPTTLPDALNMLPQFLLSSSPARSTHNFATSASHGNILNLRGIRGINTLILFDGLRVPPTTYRGETDVNVLPTLLVKRVDVVTAGASAAYGSDAVAGVVSFVLDRKFTGVRGLAQSGISQRGDNGNRRSGLALGSEVFDGGHLLLSAELSGNDGMLRSDRPAGRATYVFAGGTGIGAPGSATNPFVIYRDARVTIGSEFGLITGPAGNPSAGQRFGADGSLGPFDRGTPTGSPGFSVGGDGYAIPIGTTAIAPNRTRQGFARLSYPVSAHGTVFGQAIAARSDLSYTSLANSFLAPTAATLFSGNPYLPAAVQRDLATPDSFVTVARYGGAEPRPHTRERTDLWMITTGYEGRIARGWHVNVAYAHGRSTHDVAQDSIWNWQRTYAAIDAVNDIQGRVVCHATLSPDPAIRARFADCRPLNILVNGQAFVDQPGYAYAIGQSRYRATIDQDFIDATISGSVAMLPAGPVDVTVGAQYRRQQLDLTSNADPALLGTDAARSDYFAGLRGVSPSALFYWLTNVGTGSGRETVKEAFGEFNLPLLADRPAARALTINGAARVTDYRTSGTVATWKLGAQWLPIDDVRLRGTLSRDIRAPSLFELFAGEQSGIGLLVDPRSGLTGNVASVTSGNPSLRPERARTISAGAVFAPRAIPGLRLSADYYRLTINGQIGTLSISQIAQNCFADARAAAECAAITQPDPTRLPASIRVAPANIAFLRTSGIDIEAAYHARLDGGELSLRLYASYLDSFLTRQSAAAPVYDFAGFGQTANQPVGRPRWRGTLTAAYSNAGSTFTVTQHHIGPLRIGSQEPNQIYGGLGSDAFRTDPVWSTDVSASRRFGRAAEFFVVVNNVFDRAPPLVPGTSPGLNLPTIISLYDSIGRSFTAGVRIGI